MCCVIAVWRDECTDRACLAVALLHGRMAVTHARLPCCARRWSNVRRVMHGPLIDPELAPSGVADWVDRHTMDAHATLRAERGAIRVADWDGWAFSLDTPYGQQLRSCVEQPGPATGATA